jgi:multimeric flavodoxin WrbA
VKGKGEINIKIALINGSPKVKTSASQYILKTLKTLLKDEDEIVEHQFRTDKISNATLEELVQCDVLVFAFPLYVDGVPSHLINCLYEMEGYFNRNLTKKITVYSLVNSGFYEGQQNAIALETIKNWCHKSKVNWGQGTGIGGGGMLASMENVPQGKGPTKDLWEAFKAVAMNISVGATAEDVYVSPNFPRFAYKFGAEMGWRQKIKANGLRVKDLNMKK